MDLIDIHRVPPCAAEYSSFQVYMEHSPGLGPVPVGTVQATVKLRMLKLTETSYQSLTRLEISYRKRVCTWHEHGDCILGNNQWIIEEVKVEISKDLATNENEKMKTEVSGMQQGILDVYSNTFLP